MGTYLEDYLESMYMLPSEIKRNFDLMRELDKTTYPLLDELKAYHVEYLVNARKKVVERCMNTELGEPDEQELRELVETDTILEQLRAKLQRVTQKLDEKVAIAAQSYDLVDHNIRRLDQDLDAYAALLKQNGEYEDDKIIVKKRKIQDTNSEGITTSQAEKPPINTSTSSSTTTSSSTFTSQRQQNQSNSIVNRKANTSSTSSRKRTSTEPAPVHTPILPAPVTIGAEDLPIDPNEPIYCHCRRVSYGQMVGCDNDDCKYEWFHFECVGLTDQPQGKWYCKDCTNMLGLK